MKNNGKDSMLLLYWFIYGLHTKEWDKKNSWWESSTGIKKLVSGPNGAT